jgi:DNA-binding MltR family transcriptional regulator
MAIKNNIKNSDAKLATVSDPILDKIDELHTQLDEETRAKWQHAKAAILSLPARKQRTKRAVKDLAMVRRVIRILSTNINSRRSRGCDALVPRQQ